MTQQEAVDVVLDNEPKTTVCFVRDDEPKTIGEQAVTTDPDLSLLYTGNPTPAVINRVLGEIFARGIKPNEEKCIVLLKSSANDNDAKAQFLLSEILRLKQEEEGDYEEEGEWFELLKKSAEGGYHEAEYDYSGCGNLDQEETNKYIELAAEGGHLQAMYDIGTQADLEDEPKEVQQKAFKWLTTYLEKETREKQYVLAHQIIGKMYKEGLGTEKDYDKALYHTILATKLLGTNDYCSEYEFSEEETEDAISTLYKRLGDMYFYGLGTKQDYIKAYGCYSSANTQSFESADKDHDNGEALYQMYIMQRDGLGRDMNLLHADTYLVKSAKAGYAEAQYMMGTMILVRKDVKKYWTEYDISVKPGGEGLKAFTEKNVDVRAKIDEAIVWMKNSADQDHVESCIELGWVHFGIDFEESFKYWNKAKELTKNNERADVNYYLGCMYQCGQHVEKDYEKTIHLFELFLTKYTDADDIRLGTLNEIDYKDILAKFDYSLEEVKKEPHKAFSSCLTLSKHKNIKAKYLLSWMFWTGTGIEKDEVEAFNYYYKALLEDKTDELKQLRQQLRLFENEIMIRKLTQISSEKKDENVDKLKAQLDTSNKQIEELKEQMTLLLNTVGKIKEKQDAGEVIFESYSLD